MVVAAVIFAVAAVLGAVLANRVRQGAPRPLGLVLTHGAVAAAGLVALLLVVLDDAPAIALWSLVLFGVAALGGFVLFAVDRSERQLPLSTVLGHGGVAVVAFLLLLAGVLGLA